MINTRAILACVAVLAIGSCTTQDVPTTTPIDQISEYVRPVGSRQFDGCTVRYAFRNKSKQVDLTTLQKQLEVPFDRWASANGYLIFDQVAATADAEISIVFTDSLRPAPVQTSTSYGLIRQKSSPLSSLERTTSKTCTIYLLDTYHWSDADLQRVLLFQVGAALGLATSTRPASAMWGGQLRAFNTLDTADVSAVRKLYNTPCDQWRQLKSTTFLYTPLCTFVVQGRAFVLGQDGCREYLPATDSWSVRRAYPQSIAYGDRLQAFALADRAFVGNSYETVYKVGSGAFWAYQPATNAWEAIAPLPQKGYRLGYAVSMGERGYVVTMQSSALKAPLIVWQYNPATNGWDQPAAWRYVPGAVPQASDVLPVVLNDQVHLFMQLTYQSSLRFDPALPQTWLEIDSPPKVGTYQQLLVAFTVRDYAYCLSLANTVTSNLRYSTAQGWKQLRTFPGKGSIAYSFVLNNRAYVGTSRDELWEYTP